VETFLRHSVVKELKAVSFGKSWFHRDMTRYG